MFSCQNEWLYLEWNLLALCQQGDHVRLVKATTKKRPVINLTSTGWWISSCRNQQQGWSDILPSQMWMKYQARRVVRLHQMIQWVKFPRVSIPGGTPYGRMFIPIMEILGFKTQGSLLPLRGIKSRKSKYSNLLGCKIKWNGWFLVVTDLNSPIFFVLKIGIQYWKLNSVYCS